MRSSGVKMAVSSSFRCRLKLLMWKSLNVYFHQILSWKYYPDLSVGDYNNDGMDDLYYHGDKENNSVAKSTIKGELQFFCNVSLRN